MRTICAFLAAAFVSSLAVAAAPPVRSSGPIPLAGTVRDVVSISTISSGLTGGSSFSQVFLDLETENIGIDVYGRTIFRVVRLNCDAYLFDCRNLRKGDAIRVQAIFSGQNVGSSTDASPMHLVAPIEWQ